MVNNNKPSLQPEALMKRMVLFNFRINCFDQSIHYSTKDFKHYFSLSLDPLLNDLMRTARARFIRIALFYLIPFHQIHKKFTLKIRIT